MDMTLNTLKNKLLILIFCLFIFVSCGGNSIKTKILSKDSTLIGKYKTTKEELESYNDLSNLSIGSKIIIPLHEE